MPSSTPDPWLGTVLAETYRIVRVLGEGGMGSVYEARHTRLPRSFAIKVLHDDCFRDHTTLARFQREAEIACRLKHRHIVEVMDYNTTPEGLPYIVMEHLEGEDLGGRMARLGRLPLDATLSVARQVAAALAAAHGQGVIHRDLKPQNIFLCRQADRDDYVKVLDFGISKLLGVRSSLTSERAIMGTPWYMAPEQARGTVEVDHRADLFALGAIVFEMLAGAPPFAGDTPLVALHNVIYEPPASLRAANDQIPAGIETVIQRALAKVPDERYQRVEEFAIALVQAAHIPTTGDADWVEISSFVSRPKWSDAAAASESPPAVRAPVSTAMRQTTLAPTPVPVPSLFEPPSPAAPRRGRKAALVAGIAVLSVAGAIAGFQLARRAWGPERRTARPADAGAAVERDVAGPTATRRDATPSDSAAPAARPDARAADVRRATVKRPKTPRRDAAPRVAPVATRPDAALRPPEKRPSQKPEKRPAEKRPEKVHVPAKKDWIITKPKIED